MKKILIISHVNVFPPYWGGASRIYNLAKFLAEKNKVLLLCNDYRFLKDKDPNSMEYTDLKNNKNIKIFFVKPISPSSQILNFSLILKGIKIMKKEKPDIILASHLFSALNAIITSWFTQTPYFLDEHNVEYMRHKKLYKNRKLQQIFLKFYEKFACKIAKKILCVSATDKNLLISDLKIKKEKTLVIPNAVDTKKFFPSNKNTLKIKEKLKLENEPVILFFGKLDYKPNYEAIKIIHNEIMIRVLKKIPNAKFLVVGDNPPLKLGHPNIIFTGLVDKIEDYINASDLVICPLLSGGGTRIKILEALSCEKIVISTLIGAEGIDLGKTQKSLLIRDDWDEFSNEIISILDKKDLKFDLDSSMFSWKKVIEDLEKVF